MTSTTCFRSFTVRPQASPPRTSPPRKKLRGFGVAFGLLLGLAAVCHGCHAGDHDDELSLFGGKPSVHPGKEKPTKTVSGVAAQTP